MSKENRAKKTRPISRRYFLKSSVNAGIGLAMTGPIAKLHSLGQPEPHTSNMGEKLNIAFIGMGQQGRVLMEACLRIPL